MESKLHSLIDPASLGADAPRPCSLPGFVQVERGSRCFILIVSKATEREEQQGFPHIPEHHRLLHPEDSATFPVAEPACYSPFCFYLKTFHLDYFDSIIFIIFSLSRVTKPKSSSQAKQALKGSRFIYLATSVERDGGLWPITKKDKSPGNKGKYKLYPSSNKIQTQSSTDSVSFKSLDCKKTAITIINTILKPRWKLVKTVSL